MARRACGTEEKAEGRRDSILPDEQGAFGQKDVTEWMIWKGRGLAWLEPVPGALELTCRRGGEVIPQNSELTMRA